MTGTILNVFTVLVGGILGTVLGNRLPDRVRETVMHGLGLATLMIGVQLTLGQLSVAEATLGKLTFVVVLASILVGGMLGEVMDIEGRLDALGRGLESRTASLQRPATSANGASTFSRGFVTASLVFCVGPMTVIGSLRDGLSGDYTLLAVKSTLDGFAALAFASSLGVGVMFAALTVLVYQGALSLAASWASVVVSEAMLAEASAAGGILLLAIGLGLLEIKRVRVGNLLPAIFVAPLLVVIALPLVPFLG